MRTKSGNNCNVSEASGMDFSVYKRNQINDLYKKHAKKVKDEVAPLRNQTTCLIPPQFSIYSASKSELEAIKRSQPTKIRFHREVTETDMAIASIKLFEDGPEMDGCQTLHSKGVQRLLPSRVPYNPYL